MSRYLQNLYTDITSQKEKYQYIFRLQRDDLLHSPSASSELQDMIFQWSEVNILTITINGIYLRHFN